jgi:hypothetical protein
MLMTIGRVPDLVKVPEGHPLGRTMNPVGLITRIGRAPGVRRLVRRREGDGVVTESPDPEDVDPRWCAACGREVLLGLARCLHCGGAPLTAAELARRSGDLPRPPGRGPASWEL